MKPAQRLGGVCQECGSGFAVRPGGRAMEFCCSPCRKAWGNRRMKRGAELYDLFMALRFDRANASRLGIWQAICRMASLWRGEDASARAGRRSWRKTTDVMAERPYLKVVTTQIRAGR